MRIAFRDVGGGVETAQLRSTGQLLPAVEVGCRRPFVDPVPCPLDGTVVLKLDTARLTPGPHRVDAMLVDVAGNGTIAGQYQVTVAPRVHRSAAGES